MASDHATRSAIRGRRSWGQGMRTVTNSLSVAPNRQNPIRCPASARQQRSPVGTSHTRTPSSRTRTASRRPDVENVRATSSASPSLFTAPPDGSVRTRSPVATSVTATVAGPAVASHVPHGDRTEAAMSLPCRNWGSPRRSAAPAGNGPTRPSSAGSPAIGFPEGRVGRRNRAAVRKTGHQRDARGQSGDGPREVAPHRPDGQPGDGRGGPARRAGRHDFPDDARRGGGTHGCEVGDGEGGRESHPPLRQPVAEHEAGAVEPARHGPLGHPEVSGRVGPRPPVEDAQEEGGPVRLGQPADLVVEGRLDFADGGRGSGVRCGRPRWDRRSGRAGGACGPRLECDPAGDAEQEPGGRPPPAGLVRFRARTRKVAWNASSASWACPSDRRHTPHTSRACRRTRASNAASSRASANRRSNSASVASPPGFADRTADRIARSCMPTSSVVILHPKMPPWGRKSSAGPEEL